MAGVDKIVPHLPENLLRKLGAVYTAAQPFEPHVVVEAPLFTGQNPASADPLAVAILAHLDRVGDRSEEHTSELQSLMRISYAVFGLKKKKHNSHQQTLH